MKELIHKICFFMQFFFVTFMFVGLLLDIFELWLGSVLMWAICIVTVLLTDD